MYLIIGASSFIGRHLYKYCTDQGINAVGTYFNHPYHEGWVKFDLCSGDLKEICRESFQDKYPDAVIICGADTSIDHCKNNEIASNQVNVEGTKRILGQAEELGLKCVFLSSEAVFDGRKGMYTERDLPNPVTLYGRQKLQIEQYIIKNMKNYLIFRISRAVGSSYEEPDIFQEFYHKIRNCEEIECLKDQSFCVTEVDDIAEMIVKSIEKNINGLYHLSSSNYISRYELAVRYAEQVFGKYGKISEKEYEELPFSDYRHIRAGLCGEQLAGLLNFKYKSMEDIWKTYIDSLPKTQYLILGANGYIGSYLFSRLEQDGVNVLGTAHDTGRNSKMESFDILKDSIEGILQKFDQEEKIAIVCIGQTNIGQCLKEYERSYRINVTETKRLIRSLCQAGFHVIYFSTDNVFDGTEGDYTENSKTHGINQYDRMKEEMEQHLLEHEPKVCIFRLSKVVDGKPAKQNILSEWESQAKEGEIRCIRGNRLSFTAMEDIYQACLLAGRMKLHGLYHIYEKPKI